MYFDRRAAAAKLMNTTTSTKLSLLLRSKDAMNKKVVFLGRVKVSIGLAKLDLQ